MAGSVGGVVTDQDGLAIGDVLFLEEAPVLATFLTKQFDEAAADDLIDHLPTILAVSGWLQDHAAVAFRLAPATTARTLGDRG